MTSNGCPLCENPRIDFYNLMKMYCSNVDKIKEDICEIHKQPLSEMALEYSQKIKERLSG